MNCQKLWGRASWEQESDLTCFLSTCCQIQLLMCRWFSWILLLYFFPHLQRKPLVLEGIDLGPCTSKWTVDYLSQVGGKKEVKIHVAAVAQMDFISKNFVYRYFLLRFTLGIQITFLKLLKYFCIIIQRPYGISSFGWFDVIME